jgi:hypothetical protein
MDDSTSPRFHFGTSAFAIAGGAVGRLSRPASRAFQRVEDKPKGLKAKTISDAARAILTSKDTRRYETLRGVSRLQRSHRFFFRGPIWNGISDSKVSLVVPQALVLVPKCKPMLVLVRGRGTEKVWRSMCFTDCGIAAATVKDKRETQETDVMDLERMKVTPRDQQVLDLLVQGCSNKEIAGQLSISPRTVKQHLRTLFLRAGIRDGRKRVRLATAAFERAEAKP